MALIAAAASAHAIEAIGSRPARRSAKASWAFDVL